jgi:23S rRNA pseudouridine955/2504/2580 synthase
MTGVKILSVTDDEDGIRLDRWFRRHYPEVAHGRLAKLLRTGQIRVNGGRVKGATRLEAGQDIRVPPFGPAPERAPNYRKDRNRSPVSEEDTALLRSLVIHRDPDVLVINKPPGLAVQGGSKVKRHLDGMLDALQFDAKERPRLVHRLDKDTSGILVLARNVYSAAALTEVFRGRDAEKLYWALVVGKPRPQTGRIDAPLAREGGPGKERIAARADGGMYAVTDYRVLDSAGNSVSWLALEPQTGRTHQLRVHCAAIGTPILGDGKYGGSEAFIDGVPDAQMLHLHARGIKIPHPRRGVVDVKADLPDSMAATWKFFNFDPKMTF